MKLNQIVLIILSFLLTGLFLYFKAQSTSPAVQTTNPTTQVASSSATVSEKTFDLVVKNRKLVSGPETLQVTEGDQVTIYITADEEEEFHLHGYDKSVDLEKDKLATLTFTANLTGKFPYELEKSKTDIGSLEVMPK